MIFFFPIFQHHVYFIVLIFEAGFENNGDIRSLLMGGRALPKAFLSFIFRFFLHFGCFLA